MLNHTMQFRWCEPQRTRTGMSSMYVMWQPNAKGRASTSHIKYQKRITTTAAPIATATSATARPSFATHVEEQHNVHVKLNAASTHVAYCQDCHKCIGKNTPGQESRKALEKHLHKKHEVDILE